MLLSGQAPFAGRTEAEVLTQVRRGVYHFQGSSWAAVSRDAKSLVRAMLEYDPVKRLSAEEVLAHPWLQQRAYRLVDDNALAEDTLHSLSNFQVQCKVRQATLHYIVNKMVTTQEVENLRKVFLAVDRNGDGKAQRNQQADQSVAGTAWTQPADFASIQQFDVEIGRRGIAVA